MIRLGVLVSGSGTNLQAILNAIEAKTLDAQVAVVVSNRADAYGLERAKAAKIPAITVDHKAFGSREAFDAAVVDVLNAHRVEWVVLAGFMRIVTPTLLGAFPNKVVNIHPALLPSFPGAHAHRDAIAYGVRISGCTVHLVDAGTDTGPILAQAVVPVSDDDDETTLAKKTLMVEHQLLPRVLQWAAEGKIVVEPAKAGQRPKVRIKS
ncbi:MAG TPA: phosphoribosylglycinamide formyltransferase [Polyangiaceae bacterium]